MQQNNFFNWPNSLSLNKRYVACLLMGGTGGLWECLFKLSIEEIDGINATNQVKL